MTTPQEENSLDEATQSEDEASPPVDSREPVATLGKETHQPPPSDDDEDTDLDDDGLLIQEAEERVETGNVPEEEGEDEEDEEPLPPPKKKRGIEQPELPKGKVPRMTSEGAAANPRPAARRPGVTLKRLVDEGVLVPGEGVFRCEYKGMVSVGELTEDGRISWEGLMFDSPSAWSIHLKRLVTPNRKADDGWKTIKYEGKFLEHFKLALAQRALGDTGGAAVQEDNKGGALKGSVTAPQEEPKAGALTSTNAPPQGEDRVGALIDGVTAPLQEDRVGALTGNITAPQGEDRVEALNDSDAPPRGEARVGALSGSITAPQEDRVGALNDSTTAPQGEAQVAAVNDSITAPQGEANAAVSDDRSGAAQQGAPPQHHVGGAPLNNGNGSVQQPDTIVAVNISSSAEQQGASVKAVSNSSGATQEEDKVRLLENSSSGAEQCKRAGVSISTVPAQELSSNSVGVMIDSGLAQHGNGSAVLTSSTPSSVVQQGNNGVDGRAE